MPLQRSGSKQAFTSNVRTLMGDVGKSPHVKSRDQALAIAYSVKRRNRDDGGAVPSDPMIMPPPSIVNANQNWETMKRAGKAAANALLIEPGWELGGQLQNIAQGQASPRDYFEAGAALPGVGAVKGLAAAAGKFTPAIFAGLMAKTANRTAFAEAERLAAKGATREQIWNDTGWFKGADDKWRFEIPDQTSTFSPGADKQVRPMREVLEHPELYAAYPDMGKIKTETWSASNEGWHRPMDTPRTPATERIRVPTNDFIWPDSARSVALHENQHAIQSREGFALGADPKAITRGYNSILRDSEDQIAAINQQLSRAVGTPRYDELMQLRQELVSEVQRIQGPHGIGARERGFEEYKRHAGEVESRNVQARKGMSQEQRKAAPPWTTEDIPREQQIIAGVYGKARGGALDVAYAIRRKAPISLHRRARSAA